MDSSEINVSRWVDERLSSLEPSPDWRPHAVRALGRLRQRDRARRTRRFRFVWASALAAAGFSAAFLLLMAPPACATPFCAGFLPKKAVPAPKPVVAIAPGQNVESPKAVVQDPAKPKADAASASRSVIAAAVKPPEKAATPKPAAPKPAAPAAAANLHYKESGLATAPLTCEIYTDYQCPACALLYRDVVPQLVADYVRTGKMRLVHRDFPLPAHAYGRIAARYANAAGIAGYYDSAAAQLFRTQNLWERNGDVDAQLTQVLPPGAMQQVRQLVQHDANLDATVIADVAMGRQDRINETPTMVIVNHGQRQPLPAVGSYIILKTYIDHLLAGK